MTEIMEPVEDHADADALVTSYMPTANAIVRSLMRRIRPGIVEYEDCAQAAAIAVLQCARRFDPRMGVPFSGFVRSRVRGAVFDLLRAELRSRGAFAGSVERMVERTQSLIPQSDTDEFDACVDLIADLGLGLMLESGGWGVDPSELHAASYAFSGRPAEILVAKLPNRLADLVRTHYFEGISFTDIAATWGLTRGRISQLHSAALKQLRELLEADL
jgi:RNA polymerase sigma factor for flagellar operon FliA